MSKYMLSGVHVPRREGLSDYLISLQQPEAWSMTVLPLLRGSLLGFYRGMQLLTGTGEPGSR